MLRASINTFVERKIGEWYKWKQMRFDWESNYLIWNLLWIHNVTEISWHNQIYVGVIVLYTKNLYYCCFIWSPGMIVAFWYLPFIYIDFYYLCPEYKKICYLVHTASIIFERSRNFAHTCRRITDVLTDKVKFKDYSV